MKKTILLAVIYFIASIKISAKTTDELSAQTIDFLSEPASEKTTKQATSQSDANKKYAFYIDYDKKILYVDSLGLPKSNNVEYILKLLPELLERPGQSVMSTYDIKINGMSLGSNADAAIEELQIGDVEKIEVSESPLSSYNSLGQGGSIDIILRDKSTYAEDANKKLWGTASLGLKYETDIMPYLHLNYKSNNFQIKGIALGELENHTTKSTTTTSSYHVNQNTTERERNNFVGVYAKYNPSEKDHLYFKAIENYNHYRQYYTSYLYDVGNNSSSYSEDTTHTIQFRFLTNYQHTFSQRLKAEAEMQYSHSTSVDNDLSDIQVLLKTNSYVNTLSGTVNLLYRLIKNHYKNYADIKVGSDYNFTRDLRDITRDKIGASEHGFLSTEGSSRFLQPYLKWEARFGDFRMQAQGEFQMFHFRIKEGNMDYANYDRNDFTGSLILEHKVLSDSYIRLFAQRKIQRPSINEVYPYELILQSQESIVKGNSYLKPLLSHNISLDYITRHNFGEHNITVDINCSYQHIDNIIQIISKQIPDEDVVNFYMQYENTGHANQVSGNLMVFYKYRVFTLSLTGNIYHMYETELYSEKHNTYYNLALKPAFALPSGWSSSLYIAYHSKIKNQGGETGDCAYTQLNIAKTIGRCNFYFYQRAAFTGDEIDTNGDLKYKHPLISNSIGVGLQYQF